MVIKKFSVSHFLDVDGQMIVAAASILMLKRILGISQNPKTLKIFIIKILSKVKRAILTKPSHPTTLSAQIFYL